MRTSGYWVAMAVIEIVGLHPVRCEQSNFPAMTQAQLQAPRRDVKSQPLVLCGTHCGSKNPAGSPLG